MIAVVAKLFDQLVKQRGRKWSLGGPWSRRPCSSLRPSSTSAKASTVSGMAVHPSDSRDENIRTVVDLERAALAGRSRAERLGDVITRLLGSTTFLIIHLV
jgi:hypothetical protein